MTVCDKSSRSFIASVWSKMAAGGVPQLGGYEYEFVGEIPDDWECLVCQLPLKDPVQIEKCGHRLCEICVGTILRYKRSCYIVICEREVINIVKSMYILLYYSVLQTCYDQQSRLGKSLSMKRQSNLLFHRRNELVEPEYFNFVLRCCERT